MTQELFFTKASAARILTYATKIEALRVFKGSIQVTYLTKKGRCSTFLSKLAFYRDFIAYRSESARNCTVQRWGAGSYQCRYQVFSGNSEKIYTVEMSDGSGFTYCSCPDYEQQYKVLGKARPGCKHVFATLNHKGYSSLAEYIDAVARRANADLFGDSGEIEAPKIDDFDILVSAMKSKSFTDTKPKKSLASKGIVAKHKVDPFGGFSF